MCVCDLFLVKLKPKRTDGRTSEHKRSVSPSSLYEELEKGREDPITRTHTHIGTHTHTHVETQGQKRELVKGVDELGRVS